MSQTLSSQKSPIWLPSASDRKSTRLNSSHGYISYAVFCLKKKKHDAMGFSPLGRALDGIDVVARFSAGYRQGAPRRPGTAHGRIPPIRSANLQRDLPPLD